MLMLIKLNSEKEETRIGLGRRSRDQGKKTRNKILNLINSQSMTHKQLLKQSGITASALSPHLKKLKEKDLIEQVVKDNKILY